MSPLARFENADWTLVPQHLHEQLERWLVDGRRPQSAFLDFVIGNDLVNAVRTGQSIERGRLVGLVTFLISECPGQAYGSVWHRNEWRNLGGLRGVRELGNRPIYDEH